MSHVSVVTHKKRAGEAMGGDADPASNDPSLARICFSRDNYQSQFRSPLFSLLSAEIRDRIFAYVLAEYQDVSKPYASETCYRRPTQEALRTCDTRLLQTCQRVYDEAWFRPVASAEYREFLPITLNREDLEPAKATISKGTEVAFGDTAINALVSKTSGLHLSDHLRGIDFWLTAGDRQPTNSMTVEMMQPFLNDLHARHGHVDLNHIRVCAQLVNLEPGHLLQRILDLEHFHPKAITVTVRHTDFWWWENDRALRITGSWVPFCVFPASLQFLYIEIESLERKKNQIDDLAAQIAHKWQFRRNDEIVMKPSENPIQISRWSGTSIWNNNRWIRDETRPETLDYYVATLTFNPAKGETRQNRGSDWYNVAFSSDYREIQGEASLSTAHLEHAGVTRGTPAAEASAKVAEYFAQLRAQQQTRARLLRATMRRTFSLGRFRPPQPPPPPPPYEPYGPHQPHQPPPPPPPHGPRQPHQPPRPGR